jgi:hypothetical protein
MLDVLEKVRRRSASIVAARAFIRAQTLRRQIPTASTLLGFQLGSGVFRGVKAGMSRADDWHECGEDKTASIKARGNVLPFENLVGIRLAKTYIYLSSHRGYLKRTVHSTQYMKRKETRRQRHSLSRVAERNGTRDFVQPWTPKHLLYASVAQAHAR